MVVLLTLFGDGEYCFSTVGVDAILRNGCGVQGENYVVLLQGSEATASFHYRSWILCMRCYRLNHCDGSQWYSG